MPLSFTKSKLSGAVFILFSLILVIIPLFKMVFFEQLRETARTKWEIQTITVDELKGRVDANDRNLLIIDVRTITEYESSHIPTSIHIPLNAIEEDSKRIDKNKDLVLFCGALTCGASDTAAKKLHDLGFPYLFVLEGGFPAWEEAGYPLQSGACPFHIEEDASGSKTLFQECVDIGLILLAGLTDGINPCAIGMMLFLMGYLIIFAEQRKKVLPIGLTYIASVFITYLVVGMILYGAVNAFVSNPIFIKISLGLKFFMVETLIIAGLINLRDVLLKKEKFTLGIDPKFQPMLKRIAANGTIPGTIILGILVTLFETPCSLPIYVGTLELIGKQLQLGWQVIILIALYNLFFILPLIIILILLTRGIAVVSLKEWEHENKYKMKLLAGLVTIALGIIMLVITS